MRQYIDKATLVAELERLYNLEYDNTSNLSCGKKIMLRHILLFLDTLEVKEINSTDAFIEKAKEFLWAHTPGTDYHVNYIVKKFEKYMEE